VVQYITSFHAFSGFQKVMEPGKVELTEPNQSPKETMNLKIVAEHSKIPFALSLSKGERDFGMLTKWAGVWEPLMLRLGSARTASALSNCGF